MATHYHGSEQEKSALDVYIKLSRASEAVSTRINQHLKEAGLTISQFGVLEALHHLGPMHQNQLGEKILKSGGNMTMVIDNLSKQELVERERDPDDRRCFIIHLTEKGQALIEKIFPRHVDTVVEEMSVLTLEEQAHLSELLRKLGLGDATEAC